VDWQELFAALRASGFLARDDAIVVSNVFAEDERAEESARHQLATLRKLIEV
jgi:myo-inositol catabolism protein IolH